jgi:hypothetical protein
MYQLAEEVSRRLLDIDMRGRALTLKVLKRGPNAPVEAPKACSKTHVAFSHSFLAVHGTRDV